MTELSQLENLDAYKVLDPSKLTRDQMKAAIRALNTFKEKRNGVLKSRTCADGRSQRNLYDKSEIASPTVSTDALMLTIIIEAFEARDVATADVVGAYLRRFCDYEVRRSISQNPLPIEPQTREICDDGKWG